MNEMNPGQNKTYMVQLKVRTFIEDDIHIARCDSLGISDHGESEEGAVLNLGNTLGRFFISGIKRGTLYRFLEQKGVEPVTIGETVDQEERIFVPVVLLSKHNASAGGHQRGMSD